MAGYRKFSNKKRPFRRPRFVRRVARRAVRRVARRAIARNHTVHAFKRTDILPPITVTGGVVTQGAYAFQLSQLDSYTEFANLYDMYMICGVQIKWLYNRNVSEGVNGSTLPTLYTVVDYDDDNSLTASQMSEYANMKVSRLGPRHTIQYLRPRAQNVLVGSGVTTGKGLAQRSQWIDMANPDIPHYGWKYVIDPVGTSSGTLGYITPIITYYFKCKNLR